MGRTLLLLCAILGVQFLSLGCLRAEGEGLAEITRVKIEEYLASKPVRTEDPTIRFERRYLTWGAISSEEYLEREGKYYTIFWKMKDSEPVTVRFEYLQAKTGRTVHVQEAAIDRGKRGGNIVDFRVTGKVFHEGGDVLAWKASIVRNGAVLTDRKSFLWKDP